MPSSKSSLIAGSQGHRLLMMTWALVPDTEKDWDLQVKLQWKRMSRVDWNKTLTIRFNEAACPQVSAGGMAIGVG